MGSLQIFEHNLSQNKKEKSIDVRTKEKDSADKDNSIDDCHNDFSLDLEN